MLKLTPTFRQPTAPAAPAEPYANEKAVTYRPEPGHDSPSVADFEKTPKGRKLAGQYRAGIGKLQDFLRVNGTPNRQEADIAALGTFGTRVEGGHSGVYSTRIARIYGEGKASLDALCVEVNNPSIPLSTRREAVENLAEGLMECSEGAVNNLAMAAQELWLKTKGVAGSTKGVWEALVNQAVREFAQQQHGHERNYLAYETHLAVAYRNRLPEKYGVAAIEDAFASARKNDVEPHRAACAAFVEARVTPDRLVRHLAEMCLSEVHEHFSEYRQRPLSEVDAQRLRQGYEDSLEAGLRSRFGQIPANVLVNEHQGGGTEEAPYTVIEDPTLLMRAIARNLDEAGVFEAFQFPMVAKMPVPDGERRFKQVSDDTFFLEEEKRYGEIAYRPPSLADLPASVPASLLHATLAKTDASVLGTHPPDHMWQMIRTPSDTPMGWLAELSHPAVRRYRDANPEHDAFLVDKAFETIQKQSPGGRQVALMQAMRQGEVALAKRVAALVDVVDRTDDAGNTALHCAIQAGFDGVAEALVAKTPNPNVKNNAGDTPLTLAAAGGKTALVHALRKAGARADIKNARGENAFFLAARAGDAASFGILAQGVKNVNEKTASGETALMAAAGHGHESIVGMLLRLKAKVNAYDGNWSTALIRAAQGGHLGCAKALLDAGADVNAYTRDGGITPLMAAIDSDNIELVELLAQKTPKAKLNQHDKAGQTVLIKAAQGGKVACLEALLGAGATVDYPAKSGETALMAAAKHGHLEAVDKLLETQADPNLSDEDGYTPVALAARSGHASVVARLTRDKRVNLEAYTDYHDTPLMLAARHGHLDAVDVLLRAGGFRNLHEASRLARIHHHDAVVQRLTAEVGRTPRRRYDVVWPPVRP